MGVSERVCEYCGNWLVYQPPFVRFCGEGCKSRWRRVVVKNGNDAEFRVLTYRAKSQANLLRSRAHDRQQRAARQMQAALSVIPELIAKAKSKGLDI